jgi:hypothetical protein
VNETSAETVKIHGGVEFLGGFDLGPFVIIGVPPRGTEEGSLETRIGADATIRGHTVIYAGNPAMVIKTVADLPYAEQEG